MDRIKKIKIKQQDGTLSDYYPIGADAQNIDFTNGYNLDQIVGNINPDEDGTLEVQLSKTIKYYNTVADMKVDTKLQEGDLVETLGYWKINDRGCARYIIVSSTSENMTYQKLDNNLYAQLLFNENNINVKALGAKGDWKLTLLSSIYSTLEEAQLVYPCVTSLEQDLDWAAIQTAIDLKKGMVFLPKGSYYISNTITLVDKIAISGENNRNNSSIIMIGTENTNKNILYASSVHDLTICNLGLSRTTLESGDYSNSGKGISLNYSIRNTFKNLFIEKCSSAIFGTNNCFIEKIDNCKIQQCDYGIRQDGSNGNLWTVTNTVITHCSKAMFFNEGRSIAIRDCDIELNTEYGIYKTNEGDIEITDSYFEKCGNYEIYIAWGQKVVNMARISGCSFFFSVDSNAPRILCHSNENSSFTVENCHFKQTNTEIDTSSVYAVGLSNSASKVKIALINNTYINCAPIENINVPYITLIDGHHGNIFSHSKNNFINSISYTEDNYNLDYESYKNYQTVFPSSANRTITLLANKYNNYNYGNKISIFIRQTENATGTLKIKAGTNVVIENTELMTLENKTQIITLYYLYTDNYNRDRWYIEIK